MTDSLHTQAQCENEAAPMQLAIPDSLSHLNIPISTYLASNPKYSFLIVSTLIFTNTTSPSPTSVAIPKLLLIQRASTEQGYPNLWEIPGGSVESKDDTILLAAAREAYEETGLHVTKVLRQVGDTAEFVIDDKIWAKLCFEVEVAETAPGPKDQNDYALAAQKQETDHGKQENPDSLQSQHQLPELGSSDDRSRNPETNIDIPITLNPTEHQSYAWATLSDIQSNKYRLTTPALRDLLLDAFAHKKKIQVALEEVNRILLKNLDSVLEHSSSYPHLPPPTKEQEAKTRAMCRVMVGAKTREVMSWSRWSPW